MNEFINIFVRVLSKILPAKIDYEFPLGDSCILVFSSRAHPELFEELTASLPSLYSKSRLKATPCSRSQWSRFRNTPLCSLVFRLIALSMKFFFYIHLAFRCLDRYEI